MEKKKKLTAFRIDEDIKKISDDIILQRAVIKGQRPETFSALLRNLIIEEHYRCVEYLRKGKTQEKASE